MDAYSRESKQIDSRTQNPNLIGLYWTCVMNTDCRNKSSNEFQNLRNVRDMWNSRGKSAIARGRGPQARTTYNSKVRAKTIDAEIAFSCSLRSRRIKGSTGRKASHTNFKQANWDITDMRYGEKSGLTFQPKTLRETYMIAVSAKYSKLCSNLGEENELVKDSLRYR